MCEFEKKTYFYRTIRMWMYVCVCVLEEIYINSHFYKFYKKKNLLTLYLSCLQLDDKCYKEKKKINIFFSPFYFPPIETYRHESLDRIRSGLLTYIWCEIEMMVDDVVEIYLLRIKQKKMVEWKIKVKKESFSIYYGLSQYTAFGFIGILQSRLFFKLLNFGISIASIIRFVIFFLLNFESALFNMTSGNDEKEFQWNYLLSFYCIKRILWYIQNWHLKWLRLGAW